MNINPNKQKRSKTKLTLVLIEIDLEVLRLIRVIRFDRSAVRATQIDTLQIKRMQKMWRARKWMLMIYDVSSITQILKKKLYFFGLYFICR